MRRTVRTDTVAGLELACEGAWGLSGVGIERIPTGWRAVVLMEPNVVGRELEAEGISPRVVFDTRRAAVEAVASVLGVPPRLRLAGRRYRIDTRWIITPYGRGRWRTNVPSLGWFSTRRAAVEALAALDQ